MKPGRWYYGTMRTQLLPFKPRQPVAVRLSKITLDGRACYWLFDGNKNLLHVAQECGGVDMRNLVKIECEAVNQDKLDHAATRRMKGAYYYPQH